MADRYVESNILGIRIPCDGPLDVQVAQVKLEEQLQAENKKSDVEWNFISKARKNRVRTRLKP